MFSQKHYILCVFSLFLFCSLTLGDVTLMLGGQYTGVLLRGGTSLEMTRVKVSEIPIIYYATFKFDSMKVEGGEVGIKVEGESWNLDACTITDSRVRFCFS